MSRRRSRAAAFLVLAPFVGACQAYVQAGPPRDLLAERSVDEIHVGRADGRIVVLQRPTLEKDTVWSRSDDGLRDRSTGVALKDVQWAMVRGKRPSLRTAVVGTSIVMLTALWVVIAMTGF